MSGTIYVGYCYCGKVTQGRAPVRECSKCHRALDWWNSLLLEVRSILSKQVKE